MRSVAQTARWLSAVLALSLLLAACGDDGPESSGSGLPAVPDDWQVVASSCGYRFRAAADLVEVPVTPIDSCSERFVAGDCVLVGDVGGYAPDLEIYAGEPEHRSWVTRVGGRPATVREFRLAEPRDGRPWIATLEIAEFAPDNPETTLLLWLACGSVEGRERLVPLLGTIEIDDGTA